MKRFAGAAVVLGLLGVLTALVLWWLPSDDFLFVPDKAKPLADKVEVEGGRTNEKGDVYYVDLFVRRVRLLEQLLPFTRPDGVDARLRAGRSLRPGRRTRSVIARTRPT